jgi:hypothetical protein
MAKKEGLKQLNVQELADCSPEVVFWVCNGTMMRNLHELAKTVEGLDDNTFKYHVNQERNDFARWVEDIFADTTLANKLRKAKKQKTFAQTVNRRLKELEAA